VENNKYNECLRDAERGCEARYSGRLDLLFLLFMA
jgi:hypothetical protein